MVDSVPGEYSVGVLDVEFDSDPTAVAGPFQDGHTDGQGSPDPEKHLAARLFYPSAAPQPAARERVRYMPDRQYAAGLARYGGIARTFMTSVIYLSTFFERIPAAAATPPATAAGPLPVLLFSHGLAGNRLMYSRFLSSIASHGFLVVAVEHTDGLGSTARLAGDRGWLTYKGWGAPEFLDNCTRHRVAEMKTALRVVSEIAASGAAAEHIATLTTNLRASGSAAVLDALKGRVDMNAVALAGHSWGGATVAATAPQMPEAKCAVLLDTWYPAIPKTDRDSLGGRSPVPLLALGSSTFHKRRDDTGGLVCDGQKPGLQARTLAAHAAPAGGHAAVLVVPSASPHTMVDDLGAIFKEQLDWLFKLVQPKRAAQSKRGDNAGLDLADRCADSVLAFCSHTLPVSDVVRQSLQAHLAKRRGTGAPDELPPALAGVMGAAKATVEAQLLLFGSGGAYNGRQAPGYDLLEVHAKDDNGDVTVLRDAHTHSE